MSNALLNAKMAVALGVKSKNIIIEVSPKDTKGEVLLMKNILQKNDNYILVTSAMHMTRAMKLYHSVGLHPMPAPTDFHKNDISTYWQLPSISSLNESQVAIREYLGILWSNTVAILNKENEK
jgi:uncharacterized SAM-binding protein YcdF (DUF218 family)